MSDEPRVTWITGAGSGMGRAAAVAAAPDRRVALSGRRQDALEETAELVARAGGEAIVIPVDTRDHGEIMRAHVKIRAEWGRIDELVLAAGLNSPRRSWADQIPAEADAIIATNLNGVVNVMNAAMPDLRASGSGQVVVISSYSAWRFTPYAGVAYSASKAALAALCQTVNAQEAAAGIRACHLCPGDVDTEFLRLRPKLPNADARAVMLHADDVGRAVRFILESPPYVRIDELVISPISQI